MYEIGKTYRVPCIRETFPKYLGTVNGESAYVAVELVVPIYNHTHSDKENGQDYNHYHANYQFIDLDNEDWFKCRLSYHRIKDEAQQIEYRDLVCLNEANRMTLHYATPVDMISASNLASDSIIEVREDGIVKMICPHTGYDLTDVKPVDGVIRCPMHQLCFDFKTKKLIK